MLKVPILFLAVPADAWFSRSTKHASSLRKEGLTDHAIAKSLGRNTEELAKAVANATLDSSKTKSSAQIGAKSSLWKRLLSRGGERPIVFPTDPDAQTVHALPSTQTSKPLEDNRGNALNEEERPRGIIANLRRLERTALYHPRPFTAQDRAFRSIIARDFAHMGYCLQHILFGAENDQHGYAVYSCDNPASNVDKAAVSVSNFFTPDSQVPVPNRKIDTLHVVAGGNGMLAFDSVGLFADAFAEAKRNADYDSRLRNLMMFFIDLPGYADNGQGPPSCEKSLDTSVHGINSWLDGINKHQNGKDGDVSIRFFGHSLGTAIVSQIAAQPSIAKLTTRVTLSSPMSSSAKMARVLMPKLPLPVQVIRLLSQHPWDNEHAISQFPSHIDLHVLHAVDDEIIPYSQSGIVVAAGRRYVNNLRYRTFQNGRHNGIYGRNRNAILPALVADFDSLEGELYVRDENQGNWWSENLPLSGLSNLKDLFTFNFFH